jgi:hypothetical protein
MFRFTIRDVLWLTMVAAMGVALWAKHRAHLEAAQDAKSLADFSLNGPACGLAVGAFQGLQQK